MNLPAPDPLRSLVGWLATHAHFPSSRLDTRSEAMLCMAALAAADEAAAQRRFLIQRSDSAMMSAQRTMANRRKQVHFKCDNSAKV